MMKGIKTDPHITSNVAKEASLALIQGREHSTVDKHSNQNSKPTKKGRPPLANKTLKFSVYFKDNDAEILEKLTELMKADFKRRRDTITNAKIIQSIVNYMFDRNNIDNLKNAVKDYL